MPLPTLADLKEHLRIRHDADDADLQDKLDAAIDYAEQFIGRSIPWQDEEGADVEVPKSVGLAIKKIAREYYVEDSPPTTDNIKIKQAENMLHFYRVGLGI